MIPAIMCGNTCVWKTRRTPRSSPLPCSHHARGRPARRRSTRSRQGSGAGQYLIDAVDEGLVNKISFTGSTGVGKMIGEVWSKLVSCSLELGGKTRSWSCPPPTSTTPWKAPTGALLAPQDNDARASATSSFTSRFTTSSWRNSWRKSRPPHRQFTRPQGRPLRPHAL